MHTAQALHNAQALPCMPIWAGPGSRYDKQALLGMHQGVTATWQTHLPAASIMYVCCHVHGMFSSLWWLCLDSMGAQQVLPFGL